MVVVLRSWEGQGRPMQLLPPHRQPLRLPLTRAVCVAGWCRVRGSDRSPRALRWGRAPRGGGR